jgi:D-threo-aldose 1-dehydrogenase
VIKNQQVAETAVLISTLGFGGAPLGGLHSPVTDQAGDEAIAAALDHGIRYFDTAPMYGRGLSEHRLGAFLRNLPKDQYSISTKVGRLLHPSRQAPHDDFFVGSLPFDVTYDYSYDGTMRSVEDSFNRLGTSYIDVVYIHDVSERWHGQQIESRFDEAVKGAHRALLELKRTGFIGAIGVGVNDAEILVRFAAAATFDIFMLAARYSLLDQTALDELFPLCIGKGISVAVAAPFAGGVLTGSGAKEVHRSALPAESIQRVQTIQRLCEQFDVQIEAAALQFSSAHPAVSTVVAGFRSSDEVALGCRHLSCKIPDAFWEELKAAGILSSSQAVPLQLA